MTRKEAIEIIDRNLELGKWRYSDLYIEALEMAIKTLEQEPYDVFDKYGNYKYPSDVELREPNMATSMPCEDAISRQAVLDTIESWLSCDDYNEAEWHIMRATQSILYDLPPVTLQPKTGHWIRYKENCCYNKCSICEYEHCKESNYCPNCGCRMVKPQKSEDNE